MPQTLYWLFSCTLSFVILAVLIWLWPEAIPFPLFELWAMKGSFSEAVWNAWPLYLWGIGVNLAFVAMGHTPDESPSEILVEGLIVSARAGFFEEIYFRWLSFMGGTALIVAADYVFGGFMGLHFIKWTYTVLSEVANYATLKYLEPYLFNPWGWAFGAALMSVNVNFRDGHEYQGIFGWINSWFLGMYFFWVMFNYGLPAAIAIHFLYDFFIFVTHAIVSWRQRDWRWA